MQRDAYQLLLNWKNQTKKKPLIVQGARQVGKTWLIQYFGKKEYKEVAYFNFEANKALHQLFDKGFDISKIVQGLEIIGRVSINPGKTLVIFDEIQACPEAITALKYFNENNPELDIIAAGSLLGVAIHSGVSFPVGKVEFMTIYPMSFHEFLNALGESKLLKAIQKNDLALIGLVKDELAELLKKYLLVGGMPEVVEAFSKSHDFIQTRAIQKNILAAYENDFSKHAPNNQLPRIRMVWQSIPGQLAKENSKFIYSVLRTGARAKEFELAIEWLKDAGLIHKTTRITKPGFPVNSYANWSDFKIYLSDIGLLCAMGDVDHEIVLNDDDLFREFKGAISEQYVLQHLVKEGYQTFYWNPENATAEVDFVIQRKNAIIPIEVKSATNLRAKSLGVYFEKYRPSNCIRTSLADYKKQDWLENIPLYCFQQWLLS